MVVDESYAEFTVLSAVAHTFVEPVGGDYVVAPGGGVATVECGACWGEGVEGVLECVVVEEACEFDGQGHAYGGEPMRVEDAL